MNEDYLWDKSGDPDPEIEQLENVMGRLRFKRPIEPLPLPATTPPRRSFRLSFSPALAAAAALILLLLAGGLWLGLRNFNSTDQKGVAAIKDNREAKQSKVVDSGPRPPIGPETPPNVMQQDEKLTANVPPSPVVLGDKTPRRPATQRQVLARLPKTNVSNIPRRKQLDSQGEQAKAQLILALHIASDKLNTVQKKIQANPGT